jgi:hypothetical protein
LSGDDPVSIPETFFGRAQIPPFPRRFPQTKPLQTARKRDVFARKSGRRNALRTGRRGNSPHETNQGRTRVLHS